MSIPYHRNHLTDYYAAINTRDIPDWSRKGQFYFNTLRDTNWKMYEKFRDIVMPIDELTRKLDPFNNDDNIPAFLEWLIDNWE